MALHQAGRSRRLEELEREGPDGPLARLSRSLFGDEQVWRRVDWHVERHARALGLEAIR